jgi:hypothetical protein
MFFGPRTVFLLNGPNGWRAFLTDVHHLTGETSLWWCPAEREFAAPTHGERFDEAGDVVGGPPRRGLDQLRVQRTGEKLTVHVDDVFPGRPVDASQQRPLADSRPWDQGAGSFCDGAVKAGPPPAPPAGADAELSGLGVPGLRVVFDDKAYESWEGIGRFISLGAVPANDPPVATPAGILTLGSDGPNGVLWLRTPDGPQRVADGVTGFAVSSDGRRVALSKVTAPGTTAELQEVDVASRAVLRSQSVGCLARVRGYGSDLVLLDMCDGAAATAAIWSPSASSVTPLDRVGPYGHVLATDPARRRGLLTEGDGPCAVSVIATPDGASVSREQKQPLSCEVRTQSSFAPSGEWLAVASGDFDEPDLAFVDVAHGQRLGDVAVRRVVASAWVEAAAGGDGSPGGGDALFAVSHADDGYRLVRCVPSSGECTVMARLKERPTSLLEMAGT